MNTTFKSIPYERLVFFDIETVRGEKELDPNSELFRIWQYKKRDKVTMELMSVEDTIASYNKEAALFSSFNRIVVAVLGRIDTKTNKIISKVYRGEEKALLEELTSDIKKMNRTLVTFNGQVFDLPTTRKRFQINGLQNYPEIMQDSDVKPWNVPTIDIMVHHKGSGFVNESLDELCWAYGIPSPKQTGVKGSEVSNVYWEEGDERIANYCLEDVKATINLFRVLRGDSIIE